MSKRLPLPLPLSSLANENENINRYIFLEVFGFVWEGSKMKIREIQGDSIKGNPVLKYFQNYNHTNKKGLWTLALRKFCPILIVGYRRRIKAGYSPRETRVRTLDWRVGTGVVKRAGQDSMAFVASIGRVCRYSKFEANITGVDRRIWGRRAMTFWQSISWESRTEWLVKQI